MPRNMERINQNCSKHFTYKDLIICSETVKSQNIANQPIQDESWNCLADLARALLDPIYEEFGVIGLTYGFCSHLLSKTIKQNIYPSLDQHSSMEKNSKGNLICHRGGAAVDFKVKTADSSELARWIVARLEFDRLYYYGQSRPIHISYKRDPLGAIVLMRTTSTSRKRIPKNITKQEFLGLDAIGF